MPGNSTHKCTNAVNNVQPIRNASHMAKILSVYNRLQARDYENGNGGKRRVSRLTQFIHATLQMLCTVLSLAVGRTASVETKHNAELRLECARQAPPRRDTDE